MSINKPIIIVGTGRCGSTFFHRILARHEDVGWLSPYNEVLPTQMWLSRFSNLYRSSHFSEKVKHLPYFPKPFECYKFWEHYLPGFSRRDKPQTAEDVYTPGVQPVRHAIEQGMRAQDKSRFLAKVTGWSRMAYFDQIFPDALFIFLNREHRSVVSSWVQAGWLDVTSSPESESWQWGDVPEPYMALWRELGGSALLSAALKIQLDLDDIRKNVAHFEDRTFKLQYEDLIGDPIPNLKQVVEFCQLPWTQQFETAVNSLTFYNPTNKWRKYLSEEEGETVMTFFDRADDLQRAGIV